LPLIELAGAIADPGTWKASPPYRDTCHSSAEQSGRPFGNPSIAPCLAGLVSEEREITIDKNIVPPKR